MKIRKIELIIFALIIAGSIAAILIMNMNRSSKDYGSVTVSIGGEEFGTYSLDKDRKIDINGTNTLRIKNHEAKMIEASCPDHICMSQSAIGEHGGMIVCLPNQVIVTGNPSAEAETSDDHVDIITQ